MAGAIIIGINYNKRLFDKSKPDIFKIDSSSYGTATGEYYAHYMVQRLPKDIDEAKSVIDSFLKSNDIPKCYGDNYNKVEGCFMMPSWDFPVYFEEDSNYFIINDFITNYYQSNAIIRIWFINGEESDYVFHEDKFNKLCR